MATSPNVNTIPGVSTSDTAFIDFFVSGPLDRAVRITSFADFQRTFRGLDSRSESSYQISQYYLNGGATAYVVRVAPRNSVAASLDLAAYSPGNPDTAHASRFRAVAANAGAWGNQLRITALELNPSQPGAFAIQIQEIAGPGSVVASETFAPLSMNATDPNYCVTIVNTESSLIQLVDFGTTAPEICLTPKPKDGQLPADAWQSLTGGSDGTWQAGEFANALSSQLVQETALLAMIAADRFDILCLPATANLTTGEMQQTMLQAQIFCQQQSAFYIVDIPNSQMVSSPQAMASWFSSNLQFLNSDHGAIYYPRVTVPDPLNGFLPKEIGCSGTLAGLYTTTDVNQGVWKAPAGIQAPLNGVTPVFLLTDQQNGLVNPLGINAIRTFPVYGVLSWGARTLRGADALASEWKYVPVRRLGSYIENSLTSGLAWVVFEPNGPALWSSITASVIAFMNDLFRQGAFQGATPNTAYFVTCDATTTTQADIDSGIVNVLIGFAPEKPAEFVIIQIQQIAAQSAA